MEFVLTTPGVDLDKLTGQAAKALIGEQKKLGKEIAKFGRRAILADVKSSRGSLRFGTNRATGARYRLGIKYKIVPGAQLTVTLSADPQGFWSIVEFGSRAHDVHPRRGRAGHGGHPAALKLFGAEFYAAHVYVAGTTGRPHWASSETALDAAVTPIIEEAFGDIMDKIGS